MNQILSKINNFFLFEWRNILLIFLPLFIFYVFPVLFFNKTLLTARWLDGSISEWNQAPLAALINLAFKNGEFPLWNPYNGLGAPLAADIPGGLYNPFYWIVFIFPSQFMWDMAFILRFFCCGFFLYIFIRSLKVRTWIALMISILYSFSGHLFYFGNSWHITTLAFIPLLFYGIQKLLSNKFNISMWFIPVAFMFMITGAGLLDLVLFAIFLILLFLVILLFEGLHIFNDKTKFYYAFGKINKKIFFLLFLLLLGIGLSAIYLLPLLEMKSLAAPMWKGRSGAAFNSLEYFLSLFFNKLTVTPANHGHYYMKFRQYLSIFVLLGLCFSIVLFKKGNRSQKVWLLASSLFLFFYFGKLYNFRFFQFINNVPILNLIRYEKYIGMFYLLMHIMAAIGFNLLFRVKERKNYFFIISTIFFGVLVFIFLYYKKYINNLPGESFLYFLSYIFTILIFYLFLIFYKNRKLNIYVISALVLLNIGIDMKHVYFANSSKLYPQRGDYSFLAKKNNPKMPVRVFEFGVPPKKRAPYQLFDIAEYSDLAPKRYFNLFKHYALKGKSMNNFVLTTPFTKPDYENLNHSIFSFLSVGFFMLKPNMNPIGTHKKTNYQNIVYNEEVFPRAYMVYNIECELDNKKILNRIIKETNIFRYKAFIEHPKCEFNQVSNLLKVDNRVTIIKYKFNQVYLEVYTEKPGMLILNDLYYPGWEVKVNNKKQFLHRANYLYRGVFLKNRYNKIVFNYNPMSFKLGSIITIFSIILLLFLFILDFKRSFLKNLFK